jgi:hypothetical protein
MFLRGTLTAAAIFTAATGSASPAAAEPSITSWGGLATSPLPFPECPAGEDQESPGCVERPDPNSSGTVSAQFAPTGCILPVATSAGESGVVHLLR